MTASSNFGNMFSVMAASAFLPFLPMLPIHLLIQNLLYDISQTTIPFDRMDAEYLRKPRKWDASDLSRFMIFIGPISSIFDIVTYLVMWYAFGCQSMEQSNAVPIRMVYRRLAVADPDCAHDTYPESPLHTKLCLLASNWTYPADYGHRYPAAFHPVWKLYRTGSAAIKLFPLALRYPVVLLHTDSIN